MAKNFVEELKWRGLVDNVTSEEVEDVINNGEVTFYIGTDPTADSLHIGHYSSLLMAKRLEKHGHHPIMLVGGATGFIGDPKATGERSMLTPEVLKSNYDALHAQISKLWGFDMVNNLDWTKDITIIDFLRDYGKFFNVNYMLGKDTVARRLETGITYTEFSYMIMQALDFCWLYENMNCEMQVAGQDQWGNITAGIDLIRKKLGKEAYGFTMPLLTKKDGTKFGKTNGKAIWLDREKTSPYEMYQFFVNVEDEKVIDYLKFLTFLSKEEIEELEAKNKENPHLREAHKKLAEEVITFVHGHEAYEEAVKITEALFNGKVRDLTAHQIKDAFNGIDPFKVSEDTLLVDVLVNNEICSSKREAREFITNGSITVNDEKITDVGFMVTKDVCIDGKFIIIRRGKKNYYIGVFE